MVGIVGAQLVDGAESPCDAYGVNAGSAGCLHVHSRVADIQHIGFLYLCGTENLKHNRRVGFHRHSFFLSLYGCEADRGKQRGDQSLCRSVIFVGRNGDFDAVFLQVLKQLGNAVVGMGIVGVVDVVVSGEVGSDFFYNSLVALVFGQRALNEFAHTVAHIHGVGF